MSLASDIASVLESLSYGTWGGGTLIAATIATNREPAVSSPDPAKTPANTLTVYLTGGPPDTLTYDGDTNGERPAQVRFRDADPLSLETRVESLYALWSAWQRYPAYFLRVKASTKPFYGFPTQDSNQGSLFIASFNITCIRGS